MFFIVNHLLVPHSVLEFSYAENGIIHVSQGTNCQIEVASWLHLSVCRI
jgi:hypothetical protein